MRPRVKDQVMYARKYDVDVALTRSPDKCAVIFVRKEPSSYEDSYAIYVGKLIPKGNKQ